MYLFPGRRFAGGFFALLAVVAVALTSPGARADIGTALDAAIASEVRSDAEKARDRNRRPKATLEFFGLQEDSRVIEIFPGGGWYTKIIAPVVRDNGQYYAVGGLGKALGFGEVLGNVRELDGFDAMEIVDISGELGETSRFAYMDLGEVDLGIRRADLALTFRNLHNLTPEGRASMYKAVHQSLKRGGRFGVIDHTRRHMQGDSDENWRRLDPVLVIKEVQGAGFRFVDFSNLHYRLDDELIYEVGRRSVAGNTDRFTLLFEKP